MPFAIGFFVEAAAALAVRFVGYDGPCATVFQPFPQVVAVVGFITQELLCRLGSADETLRDRVIMRLATGQENGKKTALSICNCVDFRIAPAARASNRLRLLPPFPPAAERCALMCVESIICISVARPRSASSRNSFSHTPRRAQRAKRL